MTMKIYLSRSLLKEVSFEVIELNIKWLHNYYLLALAAHAVENGDIDTSREFDIIDEHRVPIESFDIIKQFKSCSHFFVEIDIDFSRKSLQLLSEVSEQ